MSKERVNQKIPAEAHRVVLLKDEQEQRDSVLVEECRNGDAEAFGELVRRYKDRVYGVAYRFLGNHEDAQDVAQEVFVRAYHGIQGFQGRAKVYTWLYSIAGNLARNRLRDGSRKGRNRGVSLEALADIAPGAAQRATTGGHTPEDVARGRELDEALQRCLEELPEHYRMTFVLRTFEQLSYDEIADAMGCPKGTVKSRLNQARAMLAEKLEARALI